jgi:hypothetical protein
MLLRGVFPLQPGAFFLDTLPYDILDRGVDVHQTHDGAGLRLDSLSAHALPRLWEFQGSSQFPYSLHQLID